MSSFDFNLVCPMPLKHHSQVMLAHGGGGSLMHELITEVFSKAFDNPLLKTQHDSAVFNVKEGRLAFTTDSYVVRPLFFPGGDIGTLAINGTVNDLAMSGARPLYLSVAFVLEEGFPIEHLVRIVHSMKIASQKAGVQIITGDTKVVDRGKGDGVYINTSGVGVVEHSLDIAPHSMKPDDVIILNGDLARHGISIISARENLEFESQIESDTIALSDLVMNLLEGGIKIHCMRDLTRGGLATSLNELSQTSELSIDIDEKNISIREDVRGACEILGFDPLYVANEGRFVVVISPDDADHALQIMHQHTLAQGASIIGRVSRERPLLVTLQNSIGTSRILDMLSGEQLPRIC